MLGSGDGASAVIVGTGVFGASLADALTARRWDVTLVERYSPANSRSSSGDVSRLLRFGHGDGDGLDEWYTRSAWAALQLWRDIGEEERRDLLVNTGAMWLVCSADGWEVAAEATMQQVGVPSERVSQHELSKYFPDVHTDDLRYGLYEPAACVVRAAESVQVLVGRALRRNARLVHGPAAPHRDGVSVNDEVITADRVIWACGAWLGQLFPQWAPVTPTRQNVFYWNSPPRWRTGPAWVDNSHGFYGFPDLDGAGLKGLSDSRGPRFDLENGSRQVDPRAEAEARDYLAYRFPALAGVGVLRSFVMHYEMTPRRRFLVGPLPGQDRVWLLGGGSGHGFKHGPALGAYLADVLEGRQQLDPRFTPTPGDQPADAR